MELFFDFSGWAGDSNIAVMTKRTSSPNELSKRKQAIDFFGFNSTYIALPTQVHSNTVRWVDSPGVYQNTDGLLTINSQIILSLQVADCVPVFICHPEQHLTGLVHAGWRGTAAGIIENTIQVIAENHCSLDGIKILLGPSIQQKDYQVDMDAAQYFHDQNKAAIGDKWLVDIPGEIETRFTSIGVNKNQIQKLEISTYRSECCHSYRRDGEEAGRMFAFIGNRDELDR